MSVQRPTFKSRPLPGLRNTLVFLAILTVLVLLVLAARSLIPPTEQPTITIHGRKYRRLPSGQLASP
ncbi:MAG TPA: hypothetical protein VJX67_21400, partial [Blastocatellia bacterium]|nr:hypothetical protein [Blastocatellia bacterium]